MARKKTAVRSLSDRHWSSSGYDKGRRTRRHIVEVATKLFASKGYDSTSIEQISRAAGMTKGATYAHFAKKRELYLACMEYSLSFFREPIQQDADMEPGMALSAYLHWMGERLARQSSARSFFIQIIREEHDEPEKIDLIRELFSESYAQMRRLIERLNPRVDSGAFAFFAFSSLLLDHDLHRFHVLMAKRSARSHTLATTVSELVGAIRHFR